MKQLTKQLKENQEALDTLLGVGRNYDVISRDLTLGSRRGRLYVIDGYGDDGVIERILSFLLGMEREELDSMEDMQSFVDRFVTCGEVGKSKEHPDIFLHCAGKFGAAPEESVVFEDSAYAIRTARNAGFPVVAVEDPISQQGKGEGETREGIARLSDFYLRDYEELIQALTPPEDLAQSLGELLG